jgi:hypothetical protein
MIGEPSESEMEEYGEPHGSSKIDGELHLGLNGETMLSEVIPFESPTKASINAIELPLLRIGRRLRKHLIQYSHYLSWR